MRDLAARVGLKASSFYNHFQSKQELLHDICFAQSAHFMQGMEAVLESEESPEFKVKSIIALHVATAASEPNAAIVFTDEWKHLEEPARTAFLLSRKKYETHLQEIIAEGIEAGCFKNIPPRIAVQTLLSALRWLHLDPKVFKENDAAGVTQYMVNLLLKGL